VHDVPRECTSSPNVPLTHTSGICPTILPSPLSPSSSSSSLSSPSNQKLKRQIYVQLFDDNQSTHVEPIGSKIRCKGAIGVGTRQSARLLQRQQVPAINKPKPAFVKSTIKTKASITWTKHHDKAIVTFVLKHRKPTNIYSLSKLLRSRAELFEGGITAKDLKDRVMQIAAGYACKSYAQHETQLQEFKELVRSQH